MNPSPQVRSRVALAALALAGYAACGDAPPEPYNQAADTEKMDYPRPTSIEKPEDYDVRIRLVARASRSTAKRSTITPPKARGGDCTLEDIKRRESGGNYGAVSSSGKYRGAYQFDARTWQSVGGSGDPAAASPAEQDARAAELMRQRGTQPWSVCR